MQRITPEDRKRKCNLLKSRMESMADMILECAKMLSEEPPDDEKETESLTKDERLAEFMVDNIPTREDRLAFLAGLMGMIPVYQSHDPEEMVNVMQAMMRTYSKTVLPIFNFLICYPGLFNSESE